MGLDNAISNLSLKNHRVVDTFVRFITNFKSLVYVIFSAFIVQGVMLTFWPFVVQKEKRLIRMSTKSSNTSNNIDTEIPRYKDREPPIADTIVPVICKIKSNQIGYLLSLMHNYLNRSNEYRIQSILTVYLGSSWTSFVLRDWK